MASFLKTLGELSVRTGGKKNAQIGEDMEAKLPVLLGNYDRPTNQPTERPTNERTDRVIGKFHFQYSILNFCLEI